VHAIATALAGLHDLVHEAIISRTGQDVNSYFTER
jgi:hypothetical protein